MTKINKKNRLIRILPAKLVFSLAIGAIFAFVVIYPSFVSAITSDLTRWYKADSFIESGQIVSIATSEADKVEIANSKKPVKLLGVSVEDGEALASINKSLDEKNVQVAIAGRSKVKVNLSRGPISRGDLIGMSDQPGIGARATEGQPVVGVAESSLGNENSKPSDEQGEIALLISVGVAPYPESATTWLSSLAGKNVSAMQMAFLFLIAIVAIVSIIVLTYSSIRNSFIAAGRNPMAKAAILQVLSQVMIMVCLVAIASFGLMYFILRL